ncbi:MAG: hypothetical protein Q4D85_13550 [Corynebacterium sp.]|uniref:hypothetical protein n=1 Tax=Corynebacterium sp. TaxID=1720 RepID=UPI0026DD85C7|nr:hypothetical protein [Corynebacterium sp.]MDO5099760.1 hypothetical protein [Corynebacterium sp.]
MSAQEKVGTKIDLAEEMQLRENLNNGEIPHIAAISDLNFADAVSVPDKNNGKVYRIPINGTFDGTDYILVQSEGNKINRVAETHIQQISDKEARLQVWIDGKPEYNDIVRESETQATFRGVRDAWNAFNSCLNSAGVPMAIVTAISIACGLLGAFTAGTAVPACVIGAAGAYAATVSFCYGRGLKQL